VDGSFTAEEALLFLHARGLAFRQISERGAMAAVGLSWAELQKQKLPTDVYLACNNSPSSVTISGREKTVQKFVEELKSQGNFAMMVNTCGAAAHTPFVAQSKERLQS